MLDLLPFVMQGRGVGELPGLGDGFVFFFLLFALAVNVWATVNIVRGRLGAPWQGAVAPGGLVAVATGRRHPLCPSRPHAALMGLGPPGKVTTFSLTETGQSPYELADLPESIPTIP